MTHWHLLNQYIAMITLRRDESEMAAVRHMVDIWRRFDKVPTGATVGPLQLIE